LRPRRGRVGGLDLAEVQAVYDREAASYDRKHHLTTRGMDTVWRRTAGWSAVAIAQERHRPIMILDLCTGTGLTVAEIASLLGEWNLPARIVGLDFNERMLARAKSRDPLGLNLGVDFVRGNAMDLVESEEDRSDSLQRFRPSTFDFVSCVCGIGGINDPVRVFEGVLQLLVPGGQFLLIDVHQPIPGQPGEWPVPLRWLRMPLFETLTFERTTGPVVLNRLWGWRDPTLDFYVLPLVTCRDNADNSWGFRVLRRDVESQRWWFGLPVMPVATMLVEKVALPQDAAAERVGILNAVRTACRRSNGGAPRG
jgi:ubiquinone/menaquinone biosynthesis C-methylase UbiE